MARRDVQREREIEIIRGTIQAVIEDGWALAWVDYGDEKVRVSDLEAAVAAILAVDEASAVFSRLVDDEAVEGGRKVARSWVLFVLGNGEDVVSDLGCTLEKVVDAALVKLGVFDKEEV